MKNVIKNYFYNAGYQILLIILPIITTPYLSRVLGAERMGTYSYTNSITQYFILFGCIGLNLYGQREIAYTQNNEKKINSVFWELLFIRAISLSVSIIIFYFTLVVNSKYNYIFLIQTLDLFASLIDISWLFQGLEDFKHVTIRNFIVRIICVILVFIFVKNSSDLSKYVLIYSSTLLIGNLSIWLMKPKFIKFNLNIHLNLKKHVRPVLMLFLPQIATSLYTVLDKTMLGLLCNDNSEVAFYEQAQIIVKALMVLIVSLSTAMMPRIANLYKNNKLVLVNEYMNKSMKFVFFLSFAFIFGLSAIAPGFVPWFYGNEFLDVINNIQIMSPIILFISLSNVFGNSYLLAINRQKEYTISIITGCVFNIIFNFILIPILSSKGASIATVIAESIVAFIQLEFVKSDFNIYNWLKDAFRYFFFGFIMFIIIIIESKFLAISVP